MRAAGRQRVRRERGPRQGHIRKTALCPQGNGEPLKEQGSDRLRCASYKDRSPAQ